MFFIWVWHQKLACFAISELICVHLYVWLHLKIVGLFCRWAINFFLFVFYTLFVLVSGHKLCLYISSHKLNKLVCFFSLRFSVYCSYLFFNVSMDSISAHCIQICVFIFFSIRYRHSFVASAQNFNCTHIYHTMIFQNSFHHNNSNIFFFFWSWLSFTANRIRQSPR